MADVLGRWPAPPSRELRRNRGLRGCRLGHAQQLSDTRHREAAKAVKVRDAVKGCLAVLIRRELRPQQVASEREREHGLSLHHETV